MVVVEVTLEAPRPHFCHGLVAPAPAQAAQGPSMALGTSMDGAPTEEFLPTPKAGWVPHNVL